VCENSGFGSLVPKGRLNLAQDASPGLDLKGRPSPVGTAEKQAADAILDNLQPSLRDLIMLHDVRLVCLNNCYRNGSKSVPQRTSVRLVYASVAVSAVLSMVSEDSGVSTI
jgi:hypothetical protein